jgi:hypothetical protein
MLKNMQLKMLCFGEVVDWFKKTRCDMETTKLQLGHFSFLLGEQQPTYQSYPKPNHAMYY